VAVQFGLGSAVRRGSTGVLALREITGGTATPSTEGLSLSFTYNCVPLGCGTMISKFTNPRGTETLFENFHPTPPSRSEKGSSQ